MNESNERLHEQIVRVKQQADQMERGGYEEDVMKGDETRRPNTESPPDRRGLSCEQRQKAHTHKNHPPESPSDQKETSCEQWHKTHTNDHDEVVTEGDETRAPMIDDTLAFLRSQSQKLKDLDKEFWTESSQAR